MSKILAFDYVVNHICSWYQQEGGDLAHNDLSKLKITKLLFFICAASASQDQPGMLNIFDNFVAMPYGHVESDMQDQMEQSLCYNITRNDLSFRNNLVGYNNTYNNQANEMLIDQTIETIKSLNSKLVLYAPFTLVDLSHEWQSWKSVFSLAKRNGKFSMRIPNEMIMNEPKIFRY